MPVTSGSTFAGYTVLRLLRRSDTGDVFLAQHPRLPHWTALKVLSDDLAGDDEFRDRFLRETPTATSLVHPHILGIEYRGESDGHLWVTMDYVNGTDAAELITGRHPGGVPAGEVLAVVTAVADALDYAHGRGILHRNVTPASILFASPPEGEQQILLTDFGLTGRLGDADGAGPPGLTGEAIAFAAPEQLTGSQLDERADQYSLAATAYFLLTGAAPFHQSNPVAAISRQLTAPPPSLRDTRPEVAHLDGAFAVALAKSPSDRFSSCREFADALSHGAGAWTGSRSPEAYLSVVDYPEERESPTPWLSADEATASSSYFSSWAKTVKGLAQHHQQVNEAVGVGDPAGKPTPSRPNRWPWIIAFGSAAAALCLGMVAVGVIIGRGGGNEADRAAAPLTPIAGPAPKAVPPAKHDFPGPGEALDGAYRIDVNREEQTYNGSPDSQPPNVTTWWAFRTACTPASCVATGAMLDESGHLSLGESGGSKTVTMDFRDGRWQSRPDTLAFACVGPDNAPAKQETTQALSLQKDHAGFRGTMTVTVESNECRQQGATIKIPTVATRVSEVPAGVEMPGPPPASTPNGPPR